MRLAALFNLELCSIGACRDSPALIVDKGRLALQIRALGMKPLCVDFSSNQLRYRIERGGGAGRALSGAVGVRRGRRPYVVDCTGGLGQDAFLLAALGCKVLLIERVPAVAALLENGLRRAADDEFSAEAASRIELIHAEAQRVLLSAGGMSLPQVAFLDPMFPRRPGGPLPARPMRMLRAVAGDDPDAGQLFSLALRRLPRVVVKRSDRAPCLTDRQPDFSRGGSRARFDVYLTKK